MLHAEHGGLGWQPCTRMLSSHHLNPTVTLKSISFNMHLVVLVSPANDTG